MNNTTQGLSEPDTPIIAPSHALPESFGASIRDDDPFKDLFGIEGNAPTVVSALPSGLAKPDTWVPALDPFAGHGGVGAEPSAPAWASPGDDDPFALFGEVGRHELPWEPLLSLEGSEGEVINGVAITPDGRVAASANVDGSLIVWDLVRGAGLHKLQGHTAQVTAAAFTPEGQRVVSASWDRTLKIWSLASGELLRTLEGHTDWVRAVVITPDGLHAVSASADKTLKVWDLARGELVRTLEGHTNDVNAVALTFDGQRAISGSNDRSVCVWDLTRGEVIATFVGDSPVIATAVTHNGTAVMAADSAGRLHFLCLENAPSVQ